MKWSNTAYLVFWAKRVAIRCRMGCSPYFAATGTHPLLSIDIAEANYLLPPPDLILSTTDLISHCAITLQKHRNQLSQLRGRVYKARVQAAVAFEKQHDHAIHNFNLNLVTWF